MLPMPTSVADGVRYYSSRPLHELTDTDRVIVLIHGVGTSLDFWCATAPALGVRDRVLALDLPGSGDSDPPIGSYDLHSVAQATCDFLAKRNLRRVTLVGHSLGALVALQMTAIHPELAAKVVLVDPTLFAVERVLTSLRGAVFDPGLLLLTVAQLLGVALPPAVTGKLVHLKSFRVIFLHPYFADPAALDSRILEVALSKTGGIRAKRLPKVIAAARHVKLAKLISRVSPPLVMIHGNVDPLIKQDDIDTVRHLANLSQTIIIQNCGHMPMLERPNVLVDLIRKIHNDIGTNDGARHRAE